MNRLTPDWFGATVLVVGNGPSMLDPAWPLRLSTLAGHPRVMVCNGGYELFPHADVLVCADRKWLAAHPNLSGFRGREIITTRIENWGGRDSRMRQLRRAYIEHHKGDVFADPGLVVEGHTSITSMVAIAVLRGARRIVLLGVDLAPGAGGRRRSYDDSLDDAGLARMRYERQVRHLTMQAKWVKRRGVEVVNCSPRSGLECYPYAKWDTLDSAPTPVA